MNTTTNKVLCCGEAVCDIHFENIPMTLLQGDTNYMHDFAMLVSGSAAKTALNLKNNGVETHIYTCVHDDVFGNTVIDTLTKAGINTSKITYSSDDVSSVDINFHDVNGKNHIATYMGCKNQLSLNSLEAEYINSFDLVFIDNTAAQDMGSCMALIDANPNLTLLIEGEDALGLFTSNRNYELKKTDNYADLIIEVLSGNIPE